jgi:hypothetical protein
MKISKDKTYKTRDGREVRILATDIDNNNFPVAAAVRNPLNNTEHVTSFTSDGYVFLTRIQNSNNLVEVKPRHKRFMVAGPAWGYLTKEAAQRAAKEYSDKGVAVVEFEFEEGEGLA